MRYTPERKEAVLKKMMPPHARPISQLSIEEGILKKQVSCHQFCRHFLSNSAGETSLVNQCRRFEL